MRIAGSHDLPAAPAAVWAALADPHVIRATTPGCRAVEPGPPLRATADWRVAALDGSYVVGVDVRDADAPAGATLAITARGERGVLRSVVTARLEDRDGGTRVDWEADCEADGPLAAIGSAVLGAALRRQVDGMLDRLGRHLTGPEPAAPGRPPELSRPPAWGPFDDGPPPDGTLLRLAVAAVAGALVALLLVAVARRLGRRR